MSNNLRQIAKDLRSFVKRCKDVHYSDSLLISFLITGLLTIAPKLHADVASEQQEITAQTYDAITDLRQSFMRARKENEKSLKGAQSELVQLLKQGDQVIKSPWASFQFGTGFTNNDWGTTYRGRGGKYLEYYRRDNDLTKYVFDKDKHLYGATNLNIPRNQEPNSLTINPANVHEPYKPYVPERLDNINMPKDPDFKPVIYSPNKITPSINATNTFSRVVYNNTNTIGGASGAWGSISTFSKGTVTGIDANITDSYRSWNGWTGQTLNSYLPRTGSAPNTLGSSLEGASQTSEGSMSIGLDTGNITTTVERGTGIGYSGWWNPSRSWRADVVYSNLSSPANSANSYDLYYNPGSSSLTGYDAITDNGVTSGYWWDWYWDRHQYTGYSSSNVEAYYNTNHTTPIGSTQHTKDDVYNNSTITSSAGTYTATLGSFSGSGPSQSAAKDALYRAIIDNQFGGGRWNWGSAYTAYWERYSSAGNYDNRYPIAGNYRDVLVSNINNTTAFSLKNFNADVYGTHGFAYLNKGTYNVDNVDVTLHASGTDKEAAYILSNSNNGTNAIVFGGSDAHNKIQGDVSNQVAFNIQDGNVSRTASEVDIKGPVAIEFIGNSNSVYRVNDYVHKLQIQDGDNSAHGTLGSDNLTTYAPGDSITTGRIWVQGDGNVIYDGQGFVDTGSALTLGDAQMKGNNNVIVALRKPSGNTVGTARVGAFEGNIMIQGGMYGDNNVAVDAASGQGSGAGKALIDPGLGGTLSNVKVTGINVGFGIQDSGDAVGKNNTLIKATNGTTVEVTAGSNAPTGASGSKVISDSVYWNNGAVERNYDNMHLNTVAEHTIVGYAAGKINLTGYASSVTSPATPSRIEFKSPVDMAGRPIKNANGTYDLTKGSVAYYATDSGSIDAKDTRAGSPLSVIAYADGGDAVASMNHPQIKITGDINATDYLVLNTANGKYNNGSASARPYTYQNIGAYANRGGTIKVVGANPSKDVTDYKNNKSLIYGMGAYATGANSNIEMENVSVVSGASGALFAENNGAIKYEGGYILHQNNISKKANGDIDLNTTSADKNFTGTRKGMDAAYTGQNDHKDITPFYVKRTASTPKAYIDFGTTSDTNIDMYDGILLNGNKYNGSYASAGNITGADDSTPREWDYAGSNSEANVKNNAKYKGMDKVTANILSDDVTIGVINQAKDEIIWNTDKAGTTSNGFLKGIGDYAGGMTIKNTEKHKLDVSLINSSLKIDQGVNVDLENIEDTRNLTGVTPDKNDPFNDIKMESTFVTIDTGATVKGDVRETNRDLKDAKGNTNYQLPNVGLSMANTLWRWNDVYGNDNTWRKTKNSESGFVNKGTVDITGGSKDQAVTALNVSYGTIQNEKDVNVDHGNGLVGTDNSILTNTKDGKITVTGVYKKPATPPLKSGSKNINSTDETGSTPTGANYGIVGISRYDRTNYTDTYLGVSDPTSKLQITSAGLIKVDGGESVNGAVTATGIYAKNDSASQNNVTIDFDDSQVSTSGIEVQNASSPSSSRGVGIALVNQDPNGNGGIITLKGRAGTLGSVATADNNIFTKENGIGIYAENAKITLKSDDFTVITKDDGVGLWVTDNSEVAKGANHTKTFQYNYFGKNDKNGFAMAFGGRHTGITHASNDLDIKFSNHADKGVTLAASKTGTGNGTYKGIAGILVNTNDGADTVTNRGNIEEDSSSETNVRAYGAVVNKGTFVNYGNIKLKDSLDHQANQITSEDMKKVNVGIFANSTNKLDTTITNRGDITIGDSTNNKNIGSWAIYGYNVNTDSKEDGSKSKITINRNNYGIYSGDGNVNIKNTKLLVGNDTVLGHVQTTAGVSTAPGAYPISRQTAYANANDLLSSLDKPRELDSAIGVYIDKGSIARDINVSADMDIDRFSFGIVMAEKNGGPTTNVTIGSPTDAPTIVLASNKNAGGQVKSTAPSNPKVPEETKEQGNSVYYYSADTESRGKSYANVSMNGDYNTAYYTKGSMDNYGTIDLRSKYDVDNNNTARGYGNVGIFSANTNAPSTNYGTIITGMSDTVNMEYSAAMAAGRNHYKTDGTFDKTTEEGSIVNKGDIYVKEKEGIGMFATGHGSKAVNYGNIHLEGESAIGMYLDRGAIGENYGEIEGNAQSLKGVVAINGGYIKNYGKINVTGSGSYGIVTDGSRFIVDANGNPTEVLQSTDSRYTSTSAVTAGQTNGKGGTDLYGGTESSIEEGTSGNPKTTGVGTTITAPDIVPITKVSVDGIDTPIFNIETDAANPGDWAKTVTVSSSIQTGGTRIIDLSAKNEWGNPVWEHAYKDPLSEVTSIGMYVDTSGVRYTNPIDGIQNLPKLGKVDLYFGPEATMYTNSKAIRIGDKVDANGTVTKSNILKPFNDALSRLPGGAKVNVLSGSLTWQVLAKLDSNNQLSEIYMSKVPYHSFAYDNDKSLVNFTNNLDNIYEIAKPQSAEKVIFNKLNSLGNGEGHILAQAFDQMRGHIYGGVQQRIKSTSDILTGEMNGLRSDRNVSKDSNKFKAFGQRNEFKTDTAGMPDWYSNAGGFAFVHEDETVRLGQSSGWSAGVVNNYFTFKDLSKSYENQAMAKVGVFKTIPLDANGTFVLSLGGDGFFGRNDMKRRFWVVDQEFRAKASYYSYGAGLNAGLEKAFVINDGFSIVPNVGIRAEYGRFSSIHENGDMALNVKSDDYVSVKPSAGIDFRYSQEVFKNSNLTASLGFAYENEIGKLYDVENEARIVGAWTDYFGIRGDKEDKRGNFKSDLKLGLDNGRFGFNVNTGYDSKGHNFRAGLGLKVLY